MRLVGSFPNIVCHLSYELELYWLFFILTEKNIRFKENKVQRFTNWFTTNFYHANTDLIMTVHFFGSKFCIIFSISLLEKFRVSKHFSVVKWRLRGSSLLYQRTLFRKEGIKSSAFFLKSVTYSFPWKRGGMNGVFFLLLKNLLTVLNKLFVFFCIWVNLYVIRE